MQRVAVIAFAETPLFELAVACEVFGIDRSTMGVPRFDVRVVAAEPGPITATTGVGLVTPWGLGEVDAADLVVVPGWHGLERSTPPPATLAALSRAVGRGARVVSFCSGAFALAAAGLLDGRRATTHWMYAERLQLSYPQVEVDVEVLYVGDDPIWTAAGTASGIDLCLHLVRLDHGAEVANTIARRMVVPPQRSGGQAQYVALPVPAAVDDCGQALGATLAWAEGRLHERITVEDLARHAHLSPRTFARRFGEATGTTPLRWLNRQRIIAAQELLETTELPVDHIASAVGLGSGANLRQHFRQDVGTAPRDYRRVFSRRSAAQAASRSIT